VRAKDRERAAKLRNSNPEYVREKQRRFYARHRERIRAKQNAYMRDFYRANRETLCERNRQPDRRAYRLAWYHANKQSYKAYYESNREKINQRVKAWGKANPEKLRELRRVWRINRRAVELAAPGRTTTEQLAARLTFYGERCWMCGAPWEDWDHVIPLSRGGSNWPANLRPACAPCNGRKWAHKPVVLLRKAA
jgi:5-methylcytosine-specific restriction endonuclease McrA